MIIVYTQKLENAITLSLALGGISHRGKIIKESDPMMLAEISEDAKENSYIRTSIGNDPAVFVWGDDLVAPYKMSEYKGITLDDGFYADEVKFKARQGKEKTLDAITAIFQNDGHHVIYDASVGTKGHTDFFCLYTYTGVKKDVRRIELTSFEQDAVRTAFMNPLPIASTFKQTLKDSTYIYIYYLANSNLPLILSKAYPPPYPKMKELPILASVVARNDEIEREKARNYYMVALMVTTKTGEKIMLKSRNAKFKTRKEAEEFAKGIPAETGITITKSLVEQNCGGPHSVDSIETEALKLFKYKRLKTDLILSQLYHEGFITSENTKSRKFPDGSEADIQRMYASLMKTNAFCDILSPISDWTIPESYFSADRKSGILITKKTPDDSFRDPEIRNIYYLICKEIVKPILGPRILEKKIASIEYDDVNFSATGYELVQTGFGILDEKKEYNCVVPPDLDDKEMVKVSYIIEAKLKSMPSNKSETTLVKEMTGGYLLPDEARFMIDSLVKRGLLIRKSSVVLPSMQANNIIHFAQKFSDLITAPVSWKGTLDEIGSEETSLEASETLAANMKVVVSDMIKQWHHSANEIAGKKTLIKCPVCKEPLYSSSKEIYCKECSFAAERSQYGRTITDEDFACLMRYRTTPILKGFCPEGKEVLGRIYLGKNNEILFTEDSTFKCPSCGTNLRITEDTKYVCPSCDFSLEKTAFSHSLRRDEFARLLTKKRTGIIDDFVDEDGVIFSAVLYLDPDEGYTLKGIKIIEDEAQEAMATN